MRTYLAAVLLAGAFAAPALADALSDARAVYLKAWQAAPLAVRHHAFVEAPAAGFGVYETRASNTFARDEPLYIYFQTEGHGWEGVAGGNRLGFDINLRIMASDRTVMIDQDDWARIALVSRERPMDFFGNVTLTLSPFPAGEFILEIELEDLSSDKVALFEMPFAIE